MMETFEHVETRMHRGYTILSNAEIGDSAKETE
jgi:hypothetical protein